jgi:hypothetical protein
MAANIIPNSLKPITNSNTLNNNLTGVLNLKTNLNLNNTVLIAKFDYESKEHHELDLKKNERLLLIDNTKNWWLVKKIETDQTG